MTTEYLEKRKQYEILRGQLENERASFLAHWRDIGDYLLPRRPRFFVEDVNRGERRNQKIIDSTGSLALRTLRSGMMAGVTSPARPWFRLTTPDPDLAEYGSVKQWLHDTTDRMQTVFLRSNLYNILPTLYGDLGGFGTAAMYQEEDMDSVVRFSSMPIGSYMIGTDEKGRVRTFFREFTMTVRQVVERFGRVAGTTLIEWGRLSTMIKNAWDQGQFETQIQICHVVQPNPDWNPRKLEAKFKRFSSCYYERGTRASKGGGGYSPDSETFLSESGFDDFPVHAPRWEVTGEDVYATNCPGMEALGDVKQLQNMEKRAAQAIEKMVNPPMNAPTSMKNSRATILPGDINYVDVREGQQGFSPVYQVQLRINELEGKTQQIRQRIQRAFYEDLFLMMAESDRRQITAREIDERQEEKLLALGPVLEQLNQDLLDPIIDSTFNTMLKQGLIPTPPDEVQGQKLRVEYISIMQQAQKAIGISGVERFAGFVGNVLTSTQNTAILDKVDMDQMVDIYADLTSIPPSIVRTDDQVDQIRQERSKQQAQQQQLAQTEQAANAAKTLSAADMSKDTALSRLVKTANAGSLVPQQ